MSAQCRLFVWILLFAVVGIKPLHAEDSPREFDAPGLLQKMKVLNDAVIFLQKKLGADELAKELRKRSDENKNWLQELAFMYSDNNGPHENLPRTMLEMAEKAKPITKDPTDYAAIAKKLNPESMEDAVTKYKAEVDALLAKLNELDVKTLLPEMLSPTLGEELFLLGAKAEGARADARYQALLNQINVQFARKQKAIATKLGVWELFELDNRMGVEK